MAVTPKKFTAAADFTYRGAHYAKGDPVTDRRHIAHLVRFGDKFIRSTKTKAASAETPADSTDAATTTQTVSPKEDS